MRVLYWSDLFFPVVGGIETFSLDLIPALQDRGHDVTVVTSMRGEGLPAVERIGSIPVHRFPFWNALESSDLKQLVASRRAVSRLKRELEPEVTHLHFGATSLLYMQTQQAFRTPTLTTVHALPESSMRSNSLFKKVVDDSRAVNAVSRRGEDLLCRAFPEAVDRISHVYYGLGSSAQVDLQVIPPSFDPPLLLCLGRLNPQKGFDVALKAFAEVEESIPGARLLVVGEGVEASALKELAGSLGIADKVDFPGPVPPAEVWEVLNRATMLLLPSRFEGLPLVALQGARMERPMIASNVDGLPELVVNRESGLVLEDNNPRALADAILSLVRDPRAATEMGRAAAQRLEERFGFDRCVDDYETLYREVARSD